MLIESYQSFARDFKKLDEKTKKLVGEAIKEFREANSLHEIKNVVDIASKKSYYRKKIDDYRILFRWDKKNQKIILYFVGPRKDIYKNVKKLPKSPD